VDKNPNTRKKITLGDWDFNRIYIHDKELFNKYIYETEYPTNFWRLNFDYLWGSSRTDRIVLWKIIDDMLAIFWLKNKRHLIMECLPIGKGNPDKVTAVTYKCLKFCKKWNKNRKVETKVQNISKFQLDFLTRSASFNDLFKNVELAGMERHVGVQNLLSLKGSKFENVRLMINRFKRENTNVVVRRANKNDYYPLVDLKNKWNEKSGVNYNYIWDDYFYERMIKNFDKLSHIVLVVEIEGKIEGVFTGGLSRCGQAWACELKFNKDFKGLCEFLYVEFAKEINRLDQNIELINLGTDTRGNGGLRNFKDKLRPVLNVQRHKLILI
jgi:hypothetical protein